MSGARRKAPPKQSTTLDNVTDWLRSVQARHPTKLAHVTDDAILGLQHLHTAIVREIMHTAVGITEEEEDQVESRGTIPKKRKAVDILEQAHSELGLSNEWQQALHVQQQASKKPSAANTDNDTPQMSKWQRKKARRKAREVVDTKLMEAQEALLQKSRDRALQHSQNS